MFQTVQWHEGLDLTYFYQEAAKRGYENNSSQAAMIDCFRNEDKWAAWILYQDDNPIGSMVAHSFNDVMGPNSFRIGVRSCILVPERKGLSTAKSYANNYQSLASRYLVPECISWGGNEASYYVSTNESEIASQRSVNRIFKLIPTVSPVKTVMYRGHKQTIWLMDHTQFLKDIGR